jgi:hypothetical protein
MPHADGRASPVERRQARGRRAQSSGRVARRRPGARMTCTGRRRRDRQREPSGRPQSELSHPRVASSNNSSPRSSQKRRQRAASCGKPREWIRLSARARGPSKFIELAFFRFEPLRRLLEPRDEACPGQRLDLGSILVGGRQHLAPRRQTQCTYTDVDAGVSGAKERGSVRRAGTAAQGLVAEGTARAGAAAKVESCVSSALQQ